MVSSRLQKWQSEEASKKSRISDEGSGRSSHHSGQNCGGTMASPALLVTSV
jgi:hypothetical protein